MRGLRVITGRPAPPALLAMGIALAACAEPEAALRVGDVTFTEQQVADLTAEQRDLLADFAALGALIASGDADALVTPLAQRDVHRSRLVSLPYLLAARGAGIDEDSLRSVYDEAPEWELSVRHVVRLVDAGADDAERADARTRAEEAERRARAGEDFGALAAELSEEPDAGRRGGLLEPGREGSWVDPFWEAASGLEPGAVSPVVETEYGYHVLRLEDRRPVPFDEAARLPLLRRVVPPAAARQAMEAWAGSRPPVVLDPPAVLAARNALLAGIPSDTLVIARTGSGARYDAGDLALTWATLDAERREALARADDAGFGGWLEDDAREKLWADDAERLGAGEAPGAEAAAISSWRGAIARLGGGIGVRPGMNPREVAAAVLHSLHATGQEALIARDEVPGLRPLLRSVHAPRGPAVRDEV